jgi:hypothetical protein
MKLRYILPLLLVVSPAIACPGPSAQDTGSPRPKSGASFAATGSSYAATANLQVADCAPITHWYRKHGWYSTPLPKPRPGGRGALPGRGR